MKRELNKYLDTLTDKELKLEIKKLFDKFEPVKNFYKLELSDDSDVVLSEFKEKIKKEYFPSRGFGQARNSVSRKIVSDFKKISIHTKDVIELLLYRTEMMIEFTSKYGDIDEPFYNSLESGFEQACKLIKKEMLENHFRHYCQELVSKTYNFGWGVYSNMKYYYEEFVNQK